MEICTILLWKQIQVKREVTRQTTLPANLKYCQNSTWVYTTSTITQSITPDVRPGANHRVWTKIESNAW